jgi:hypothetical protein
MFVNQVRIGETEPGRLTVFSEGNTNIQKDRPFVGLMPTKHLFIRPNNEEAAWNRYSSVPSLDPHRFSQGRLLSGTLYGKKKVINLAKDSLDLLQV